MIDLHRVVHEDSVVVVSIAVATIVDRNDAPTEVFRVFRTNKVFRSIVVTDTS